MVKTGNEMLKTQVNKMRASRSKVRQLPGRRGQLRESRLKSVSRPGTKRKPLPVKPQAAGQSLTSEKPHSSKSHTRKTKKIKKRHAPQRDKSPEDLSDSSSESSDTNSNSSEPVKNKKNTKQHNKRGKQPKKRSIESSEELMDTSNIDSSSSEEDQPSRKKKRLKLLDIVDDMSSDTDSDSSVSNSDDSFALGIFADSTAPQLSKNMKKRIWNREFINLSKLYYGKESDNLSINVRKSKANTLTSLRRAPQREINNVLSWSRAFQLYASIYTKKYSKEGSGMFQYMSIIQSLAHKGQNWLLYDQKFRQLRAKSQLPWGRLHVQTHLFQSLCKPKFQKGKFQGLSQGRVTPAPNNMTQQQQGLPPPGPRAIFRPGYCWTYQRYGNCNRSNCSRVHKCSLCDGQHAGTSCPRSSQQGTSGHLNQGKPKTPPDTANTNKGQSFG